MLYDDVDSFLREAEVGEFEMPLAVKHQILGLEVTMDNIEAVQMLYRQDDFSYVEFSLILAEIDFPVEHSCEVSSFHILKQEEMEITISERESSLDKMVA